MSRGNPETPLCRAVIQLVNDSRLARVWRSQSGARSGGRMHLAPAGTADIIGVLLDGTGRLVGIEAKMPGKVPSEVQKAWRRDMLAAGAVAAVVTSPAEALLFLQRVSRPRPLPTPRGPRVFRS